MVLEQAAEEAVAKAMKLPAAFESEKVPSHSPKLGNNHALPPDVYVPCTHLRKLLSWALFCDRET